MWLGHEISGNQLNMSEAKAMAGQDGGERSFSSDEQHDMGLYTVKVGDVCFVAIGQITNRPYMAVHCQPTGCIVISSTVEDQKLAAAVRAIWGKSDHRQKLLESLLVDFQTRGQWPGDLQARGWRSSGSRPCGWAIFRPARPCVRPITFPRPRRTSSWLDSMSVRTGRGERRGAER